MKLTKLLFLALASCFCSSAFAAPFIAEKTCPIYKINNEKPEKVGSLDLKKKYSFKEYKKINKREYALINQEQDEYYVNKNCGYILLEDKPKLEPIFIDEEIKSLEKINKFDKEILKLCGYFGSHPTREDLAIILTDNNYKENFLSIYKKETIDKNEFLDSLLDILFKTNGFTHSFCGGLKEDKMNGPHYYYRFLNLQKLGFIGKNTSKKCSKQLDNQNKLIDNYELSFIDRSGKTATKCTNSFAKTLGAEDLMFIASLVRKIKDTKKIESNQAEDNNKKTFYSSQTKSCIYPFQDKDKNEILFKIVYSVDKKSLITLYPIISDKFLEKAEDKTQCFCQFN